MSVSYRVWTKNLTGKINDSINSLKKCLWQSLYDLNIAHKDLKNPIFYIIYSSDFWRLFKIQTTIGKVRTHFICMVRGALGTIWHRVQVNERGVWRGSIEKTSKFELAQGVEGWNILPKNRKKKHTRALVK